jgi:hypothetical protein
MDKRGLHTAGCGQLNNVWQHRLPPLQIPCHLRPTQMSTHWNAPKRRKEQAHVQASAVSFVYSACCQTNGKSHWRET